MMRIFTISLTTGLAISFTIFAALMSNLAGTGGAAAQTYPSRPITMVVAFAAGGSGDTIGRIIAEHMREQLGQPIIVENIGGAAGTIGVGRVARAQPDGHMISFGNWPTHVLNGAIYPLNYDLIKDFEPISLVSTESVVLTSRKNLAANNLRELMAWLKANPDKASAGTTGPGGIGHVVGVFFQKETGTQFQFVPYRGLALATQDMVAGQIDMMFDTSANAIPHVRSGNIKAFAVTSPTRLTAAPDIPTVDEAGLPGFHISNFRGFWAPKGTPREVVLKLNGAIKSALTNPGIQKRLGELGQELFQADRLTPEALGIMQKAEIEKWWPVMKAANIKAQ
jgi:tripartite-type tricarboxylate transporter receptor subunit TctC